MRQELSPEEIEKLFQFVKSKNVHYIDVQHEIVDHLASAFEEKQTADPSLSFDMALSQVYSGFPITGFGQLTAAKHEALIKFWRRKFFGFMLQYMRLPKIMIFGCLSYLIYLILHNGTHQSLWFLCVSTALFSISCATHRYFYGFEFKKEFRQKYLVTSSYLSYYGGFYLIYFIFPTRTLFRDYDNLTPLGHSIFESSFLSIYVTIVLLWVHASNFEFPKMLKKEIEEKYHYLNLKLSA